MRTISKREKLIAPTVVLALIATFLVGCVSFASRESVTVAGIVLDWETGEAANDVWVTVERFVPGFPMGRLEVVEDLETTDEGRFEFSIGKRNTIYVNSRDGEDSVSIGAMCSVGRITEGRIGRIMEDRRELVILHCRDGVSTVCWDEYRTLEQLLEVFPRSVPVCESDSDDLELEELSDQLLRKYGTRQSGALHGSDRPKSVNQ